MKKKLLLIIVIVVSILISIVVISGLREKKKMEMFFSPITNKEEYIDYKECKNLSFEYTVEIKQLPEHKYYDKIIYNVIVINNTTEMLKDFLPVIKFDQEMKNYLPSPFFYIEPITLYPKDLDGKLKNYMTSYTRESLVRKTSQLSTEEYKKFIDIYKKLYLNITWDKGEEKVLLYNPLVK